MTRIDEETFGFADICAALSARFGTRFELHDTGGDCVTLTARLEGGYEVLITDCENTLSPRRSHLEGRACGFYVGVHHVDADGEYADPDGQFGSAYSETAPPTTEAIAILIESALRDIMSRSAPAQSVVESTTARCLERTGYGSVR